MTKKYLNKLLKEPALDQQDIPSIKELRNKIKDKGALPTDLLQYRFIANKYLPFKRFPTKHLVSMSHFMSHEPVTGLTLINRII